MSPSARPLVTGLAAALATVGLAASAHVVAGGTLALGALAGAFGAVAAGATLAQRWGAWSFWRLVLAMAALQPFLHAAFGASGAAGHGGHGAHHHTPGAHTDSTMAAAHVVITLVSTVLLRWGLRWLRSLPAIARALVVPRRGVRRPLALAVAFAPAEPELGRDLAVLPACGSRGPPW